MGRHGKWRSARIGCRVNTKIWSTNHKRYTSEKPHEKQCSFWVDSFGHHQLARELSDSTRQRRVKDQRNKIEL